MKKQISGIIFAALLLVPTTLFGQDFSLSQDDLGSWVSAQAIASKGNSYYTVRAEHRTNQQMSNRECWFALAAAGYKFNNWLSADLGYERWDINSAIYNKAVLTTSGTLKQGNLSATFREKYEFTFAPDGSTNSMLRSRLKTQYAIPDSAFRPYLAAEIFSWGTWKRCLFYVGSEITLSQHSSIDVFYLYHLPNGGKSVHTIGLGYVYSFAL